MTVNIEGAPDRESHRPRGGIRAHVLARVVRLVEERLDQRLRVADLAREACLSEFHFARMFRQSMGISPHAFITARRMERARTLLAQRDLTVLEVSRRCGFATQAHFCSVFRNAVGMSPAAYRRRRREAGEAPPGG